MPSQDLCPDAVRASLTILTSLRGLRPRADIDLTSIQSPWTGVIPLTDREISQAFHRIVKESRIDVVSLYRSLLQNEYHVTNSAGIYGPAMLSAPLELPQVGPYVEDMNILGRPLEPELLEAFVQDARRLESDGIHLPSGNNVRSLRRLTAVPDREGKMRIVAIFDYWSQLSLRPVHDLVFAILRRIPQDCTFDQGRFITALDLSTITDDDLYIASIRPNAGDDYNSHLPFPRFQRMVSTAHYYSVDLTTATDRFPIDLQQRVVSLLLGEQRAAAWRRLLVQTPFSYRHSEGDSVSYGAGQPMGAHSSFGVFALTHHIVVRALAHRLGVRAEYAILGDDIVIRGESLGEAYMDLLKSMHVPYSRSKSFCAPHMLEFAKRVL